jgi:hydroxymethylglutaryl-CoA reductase (NADPH)
MSSNTLIDFTCLTDEEVLQHLQSGSLKDHQLEKELEDCERAVHIRRKLYESILNKKIDLIPYTGYNYKNVLGANCEIVIGYIPIPLGIVGPLVVNGESIYVPMATTEGCLVASTNRGCKAISVSGGCLAVVLKDGITRSPCVRFPSAMRAASLKRWVDIPENYIKVEDAFNSTTNFGRLDSIDATVAGRTVHLRFSCMAGDAMGMNMVSKGCLKAIEVIENYFPDMVLVAISGNMCTDKKPAAINWILGRGKSVVVEAIIPEHVVKTVLKSTVHAMVETNRQKNLIGSAMAGSIGGFNAHAANIVTAVFLATGQDPAQNVESSNCITILEFAEVR